MTGREELKIIRNEQNEIESVEVNGWPFTKEELDIFDCIDNDDLKMVKKYIELKQDLTVKRNEQNIFCYACADGSYEIVKYLIECGFDINQRNDHNNSPIMMASSNNQTNIVKLLLCHNADISQLVNRTSGNNDITNILKNFKDYRAQPNLLGAIKFTDSEKVQELIDVEEVTTKHIRAACESQDDELITLVAKRLKRD